MFAGLVITLKRLRLKHLALRESSRLSLKLFNKRKLDTTLVPGEEREEEGRGEEETRGAGGERG